MALTPRSFLRSPSLLVALLFSAGIALVGATLFLASFCTKAPTQRVVFQTNVDVLEPLRGGGCDHLLRENSSALATWQHQDWVDLAICFELRDDNHRAVTAAAQGLAYFPASERLHNIRGYNLIVLEEYEKAVFHLRVSLQSVEPTSGIMENNLAWAGLFASENMTLSEARRHYTNALEHGGGCEEYHTGMWVEYGIASRSSGTARDTAIDAYNDLRAKYEPCTSRASGGDRSIGYEVAGAGILDGEIHKLTMVQMFERNEIDDGFAPHRSDLVRRSLGAMDVSRADIDAACEDIAPVASALPACRKALLGAMCRR